MSQEFSILVSGLPGLLAKLKQFPLEVRDEVRFEMEATLLDIVADAKKAAPTDQGELKNSIGFDVEIIGFRQRYKLFVNSGHAAYMEFGTKNKVVVPSWATDLAEEARGPGISTGLKPKEAIYAWCERQGIKEEFWYPIYREIMRNGVWKRDKRREGYLLPAYKRNFERMMKRLKEMAEGFKGEFQNYS